MLVNGLAANLSNKTNKKEWIMTNELVSMVWQHIFNWSQLIVNSQQLTITVWRINNTSTNDWQWIHVNCLSIRCRFGIKCLLLAVNSLVIVCQFVAMSLAMSIRCRCVANCLLVVINPFLINRNSWNSLTSLGYLLLIHCLLFVCQIVADSMSKVWSLLSVHCQLFVNSLPVCWSVW